MNTTTELKEEISFDEFKAWMNGLVRGKGSVLPSLEDWRMIKKMMDKVVPDKEQIIQHTPIYTQPYTQPGTFPYPATPWCGTTDQHTKPLGSSGNYGSYGCYGGVSESPVMQTSFSLTDTTYAPNAGISNLTVTDTKLKVSHTPGKVK